MASKVKIIDKGNGNIELHYGKYWSNGAGLSTLREALPMNHEEQLYNYIKRELQGTDYIPEQFGIYNPKYLFYKDMSREELINENVRLKEELNSYLMYQS